MSGSARIPTLDGLRGLFSIVVFLAHVKVGWFISTFGANANWYLGNLGVTIFFFISGYIVTTLLRLEYERNGNISLKNFFMRRIYRLLPPFYIVLAIDVALTAFGGLEGPLYWSGFLLQALHLSNYLEAFNPGENVLINGTGVMWSLAVEEHFYLLFPLVFLPLIKRCSYLRVAQAMGALCVIVLLWRCYLNFGLDMHKGYFRIATDTRIDSILAGCALGMFANPAFDQPLFTSQRLRVMLLTLGVAVLIAAGFIDRPNFINTIMFSLQSLAFFAVVGYGIRYPHWWCFRWLNTAPLIGMGMVSYTFYLIHLPILKLLRQKTDLDTLGVTLAGFALALLFSVAMYYWVETPMTKLRKKLRRAELGDANPA